MKILTLLLLPLYLISSQTLKIATYNVDNLFDNIKNGTEYSEYKAASCNWNNELVTIKLDNITKVICDIDADIIALQEVENSHILNMLQEHLASVGCQYRYSHITKLPKTTIHNALLSRIPIEKYPDILVDGKKRFRSILHVSVGDNKKLHIFANHWKAKNRNGVESKRILYAKALQDTVQQLPPNSEYLMLGDFNSNYDEFLSKNKTTNDTDGITGVNHILNTIDKDNKLITVEHINKMQHSNLWLELPKSQRWSRGFYHRLDNMDAIIIPSTLHDTHDWEYITDSFNVFRKRYLLNKHGFPKRWHEGKCKFDTNGYSDHLPIYANFKYQNSTQQKSSWLSKLSYYFSNKKPVVEKHISANLTNNPVSKIVDIKYKNNLKLPTLLQSVTVVLKSNNNAIIEDSNHDAILLYGCAKGLKEGHIYNIEVKRQKIYKGEHEIVEIDSDELGDSKLALRTISNEIMNQKNIPEVLTDIEGIYRKRNIIVKGKEWPIYFKKWVKRPKDNDKIIIHKAQIGVYKQHIELIVWDEDDYKIIE